MPVPRQCGAGISFLSYNRNNYGNTFAENITDMKITNAYIEARREGIAWLNSSKRDFLQGVSILSRSGYKPVVAGKLARMGEKAHARQKLEYEIRLMIKVWYNPNDPKFANVDLDDDATPGQDGRPESVTYAEEQNFLRSSEEDRQRESDEQPAYPPVIAKVIHTFSERYKQRAILHRKLSEMGESNADAVILQRKETVARIGALSKKMQVLAEIKNNYDKDGTLPEDGRLDDALADPADEEDSPRDEDIEGETNLDGLSIKELKKMKANARSKITKAKNMLLFSSETKPEDGKENPLPPCPKRIRYERKIEKQQALIEKIEYRLSELV